MNAAAALSIEQFRAAWEIFATAGPAPAIGSGPGREFAFSGAAIPMFNVALITADGVDADGLMECAEIASAFAASREVPWILLTTRENPLPGVDETATLGRAGLVPLMPLTGMAAPAPHAAGPTPPGLHLRAPASDSDCESILGLNAEAYGMDLSGALPFWGRLSFFAPHYPVLGSAGGQAVTTAAVLLSGDYRYVALVATHPDAQRRGYAAAAMHHALQLALDAGGPVPSFLHATHAGRPVYERMGYSATASHTAYLPSHFLPSEG